MELSERIKKYRIDNNMRQTDLAKELFVSKQAISKWETGRGLPDISLYPQLAKMLGISIDELMGNKTVLKKTPIFHWFLIGMVLVIVVAMIIVIILLGGNNKKNNHISETEKWLEISLPEIQTYEYTDFTFWHSYNNVVYPNNMYFFIFKDEFIEIDETWVNTFDEALIDYIPYSVREYINTCDKFKLINKTTNKINNMPTFSSEEEVQEFTLYCIQETNKRLIIINFNLEMRQ